MGLRIIGRAKVRLTEVSDSERLRQLEQETDHWLTLRGTEDPSENARERHLTHYRSARERVGSVDEIEEMARRARLGIMLDTTGSNTPHLRVDIATLLELL